MRKIVDVVQTLVRIASRADERMEEKPESQKKDESRTHANEPFGSNQFLAAEKAWARRARPGDAKSPVVGKGGFTETASISGKFFVQNVPLIVNACDANGGCPLDRWNSDSLDLHLAGDELGFRLQISRSQQPSSV